jgi:hypothetical protein
MNMRRSITFTSEGNLIPRRMRLCRFISHFVTRETCTHQLPHRGIRVVSQLIVYQTRMPSSFSTLRLFFQQSVQIFRGNRGLEPAQCLADLLDVSLILHLEVFVFASIDRCQDTIRVGFDESLPCRNKLATVIDESIWESRLVPMQPAEVTVKALKLLQPGMNLGWSNKPAPRRQRGSRSASLERGGGDGLGSGCAGVFMRFGRRILSGHERRRTKSRNEQTDSYNRPGANGNWLMPYFITRSQHERRGFPALSGNFSLPCAPRVRRRDNLHPAIRALFDIGIVRLGLLAVIPEVRLLCPRALLDIFGR